MEFGGGAGLVVIAFSMMGWLVGWFGLHLGGRSLHHGASNNEERQCHSFCLNLSLCTHVIG